ncbi:hypothetical protein T02_7592 [Trichinella nativa]|uniref:Uncharacterized protein n=1 Tax=Trichinella nativa TaxID=6335 RepID=A0A0V1KXR1_9BILA|nr:hypothetical protein T02_7592 [Trichinella nativa]
MLPVCCWDYERRTNGTCGQRSFQLSAHSSPLNNKLGLYGRCPCHLDISCRLESGNHEIVNVVRDAQLTAAGQRSQCEPGNLVVDRLRYRILHVLQAVVGQLKQHARIIRLTGSIQRTSSFPSQ